MKQALQQAARKFMLVVSLQFAAAKWFAFYCLFDRLRNAPANYPQLTKVAPHRALENCNGTGRRTSPGTSLGSAAGELSRKKPGFEEFAPGTADFG